MNRVLTLLFAFISVTVYAQSPASVGIVPNHNNWIWKDTHVAKNDFISVAVVPKAAGRVLEYKLGDVESLWVNPQEFGKSYGTSDTVKVGEWRNFGGYRLVPTPVDNCGWNFQGKKVRRWPPPVMIGDAPYYVTIKQNEQGTDEIVVESGVQKLPVPTWYGKEKKFIYPDKVEEEIKYRRTLSIEDNSSKVFYNHTMTNIGENEIERGWKISSQHVSWTDPELQDGVHFVAYIPFDRELKLHDNEWFHIGVTPDSRWRYVSRNRMPLDKNNPEHVSKFYNIGTNWTGEVAPGIYECHFDYNMMGGISMIAAKPWICYANKTNMTVFAKMFEPYNPELKYEHGVNIEVFNSGLETGYLETEVKTPLHKLKKGESFDFKEVHAAATVLSLPVLDVNQAGIITKKLMIEEGQLKGQYGVFVAGELILRGIKDGSTREETSLGKVSPLRGVEIKSKVGGTVNYQIVIKDQNGLEFVLDEI
ncbi:hypothetical protein [Reichenbachiella versicolor]|uniref:hypothetical protein n=1 Tax=Reichenbachiella versicolor TaxID=1821036 RepID=UPI000D6E59C1|nr:hypothetical protein [Reichenbachiella versicolor]